MKKALHAFILAPLALALCSCATTSEHKNHAGIDDKAEAIIDQMADKLEAAKTLRVSATRKASPGFYTAREVAESAKIRAAVQRPDKFSAVADTNLGHREARYDGKQLLLVDKTHQVHASTPARDTIDEALADFVGVYGFRPPLAELLVNDPEDVLLEGVKTGRWVATETVAGRSVDHLAFTQSDLNWDLWVGVEDKLPYRLRVNYATGTGEPMVTDLVIKEWSLNAAVSPSDFATTPPADSRAVDIIPLN